MLLRGNYMAGESINEGPSGVTPPLPTVETTAQDFVALPTGVSSKDSQTASSQPTSFVVPEAALPYLVYPMIFTTDDSAQQKTVDGIASAGSKFLLEMQQKQHEIALQVLQGWADSVKAEAQRIHQMITSPEFLAKMQAESSSTLGQAQTALFSQLQHAYQTRVDIAEGLTNYINQVKTEGSSMAVPLLATVVVMGGAAIGGSAATENTFASLFTPATAAIAPDMQAQLNLIGSLMASSAIYQASAVNFLEDEKDPVKKDMSFALKYADNIIDLVRSRGLDAYVNGVVLARVRGNKNLSAERRAELVALVKAMLVVSAIGLLNKIELGHLSGIEFRDLINGLVTSLPPEDVRWTLIRLLTNPNATKASEKGFLDLLSPTERARLMSAFEGFMDSNPNVNSMLKMDRLFTGVLAQMPLSQRLSSQKF